MDKTYTFEELVELIPELAEANDVACYPCDEACEGVSQSTGGDGVMEDQYGDDDQDDDGFDEDACPKCERSNCSWEDGICVCPHCGYIGR